MKTIICQRRACRRDGGPVKPIIRRKRGFTLIEVMVAIVVLVIGLLGLMTTVVTVIHGNANSKNMTTATTLAQDRIEALKNRSYTHADLTNGSHSEAAITSDGTSYTRAWLVSENSPTQDVKTVQVTVNWQWRGSNQNVTLNTIIAK